MLKIPNSQLASANSSITLLFVNLQDGLVCISDLDAKSEEDVLIQTLNTESSVVLNVFLGVTLDYVIQII